MTRDSRYDRGCSPASGAILAKATRTVGLCKPSFVCLLVMGSGVLCWVVWLLESRQVIPRSTAPADDRKISASVGIPQCTLGMNTMNTTGTCIHVGVHCTVHSGDDLPYYRELPNHCTLWKSKMDLYIGPFGPPPRARGAWLVRHDLTPTAPR